MYVVEGHDTSSIHSVFIHSRVPFTSGPCAQQGCSQLLIVSVSCFFFTLKFYGRLYL